ncbi:MAG: YcnI family protein [Geodermatophilaceae bacterium]|nr:YcnI family protein [Geodermatophilaceae bacterium]
MPRPVGRSMRLITAGSVNRRVVTRGGLTAALCSAGLVLLAVPAFAHVEVSPQEASIGGFSTLMFTVPNESAGTTEVSILFPSDRPLASVTAKDHPGWEAEITTAPLPEPVTVDDLKLTEAVTRITWTADDGVGVGPGELDEFEVSVGPLPDGDTIVFPVLQTYDDGTVVSRDEGTPAGGEEPEHPAPTLTLTAATGEGDHHEESEGGAVKEASSEAAAPGSSEGTARTLGAAGLAVGVVGLGAAGLAVRSSRRRTGE